MKKFAGILLLVCLVFIGCANPVNNNDNPTNPFVPGNPDIPANPDPVDSAFWFKEVYEKLIEMAGEISTDDYTGPTGSGTGEIANLQYICDAINAKWGTAYTPDTGTANQAANCEYLLKMIDKANSNHTTYGTGEYATKQVLDTTAVNDAINRLWAPGSKFIGVNGYAYGNLYSDDGSNWHNITSVSHIKDIVYGNGKFVGSNGTDTNWSGPDTGNYYSDDGINWSKGTLPEGVYFIDAIIYGNGKFVGRGVATVAASGSYYSDDGIAWNKGTVPAGVRYVYPLAYGNGKFVGKGNINGTFYSTDGITWNGATLPAGVNYVYGVRFY